MGAVVTEGATPIVAPPIDCTPGAGPAEARPPREAIMSETNTTHTTNSRMLLKWLRENDADRDKWQIMAMMKVAIDKAMRDDGGDHVVVMTMTM